MNNKDLANEITQFFIDYDMLEGATSSELFEAILRSLNEGTNKDIKIIIDYFKDLILINTKARNIYNLLSMKLH